MKGILASKGATFKILCVVPVFAFLYSQILIFDHSNWCSLLFCVFLIFQVDAVKKITTSEQREACMGAEGKGEESFVENLNRNQGHFLFQVELNGRIWGFLLYLRFQSGYYTWLGNNILFYLKQLFYFLRK